MSTYSVVVALQFGSISNSRSKNAPVALVISPTTIGDMETVVSSAGVVLTSAVVAVAVGYVVVAVCSAGRGSLVVVFCIVVVWGNTSGCGVLGCTVLALLDLLVL